MAERTKRINTIDRLRGLSVFLMIIANFLKLFDWIPSWMKHAHPYGLTIVDFIAPCFFFIIGITFFLSFEKRIEINNNKEVFRHFRMRALAIFGIGSLLMVVELLSPFSEGINVNILQAISLSILVSIPFLKSKSYIKIIIGSVIGLGEHFLLVYINGINYMLKDTRAIGVIGWIGLLLIGLAMGDIFFSCQKKNDYRKYWIYSGLFIVLGAILSIWIPIFHSAATLSYNFITIGVISTVFLAVYQITENKFTKRGFLCIWGSNPLIAFVIHYILLIIIKSLHWVITESHNFSIFFTISFILYYGILQSLLIFLSIKKQYIKI